MAREIKDEQQLAECLQAAERYLIESALQQVKIAEPNRWKFKSHIVWESEHGKIPKGYAIIYKDGNPLNCKLSNLHMVSRHELALLNKLGYKNAACEVKPSVLALVKLRELTSKKRLKNAH